MAGGVSSSWDVKGQATQCPICYCLVGWQQRPVVAQTVMVSGAFLYLSCSDTVPQARTGNVEWAEGLPSRCEALGSVPSTILQKPGQHLGTGGRRIRNLRLSSAT